MLSTKEAFLRASESDMPTATPAGLTCLNEAATGSLSACLSSLTSCHELSASSIFIYPGAPFSTLKGSVPFFTYIRACFWWGLKPYLRIISFSLMTKTPVILFFYPGICLLTDYLGKRFDDDFILFRQHRTRV